MCCGPWGRKGSDTTEPLNSGEDHDGTGFPGIFKGFSEIIQVNHRMPCLAQKTTLKIYYSLKTLLSA